MKFILCGRYFWQTRFKKFLIFINQLIKFLKKWKLKKNIAEKSAVTMWQHIGPIYVSNKHVLDYDVNVIFADLNVV